MNRNWSRLCGLFLTILWLLGFLSCGQNQQLVSIMIQPPTSTFGLPDPALQIQYAAIGSYIHPPETKDITAQVTWKTDIPQLVSVSGGLVSPTGNGCGIADISASARQGTGSSANITIAFASVTIDDPNVPGCPGGGSAQSVLTVAISGSGTGTVTSVPSGINCPGTCGAQFSTGSSVTLTATPNSGSTFGSWTSGCTSMQGNSCSVVLSADTTVSVTFN
jgi:Divergent InlB B-repeat domain